MATNLEPARQTMHVLVDIMSSYDASNPGSWQGAIDTATPRLSEVGALTVTVDDDAPDDLHVHIEASPLLMGTAVVLFRLLHELAAARDVEPDDMTVQLREWIDEDLSG